MANISWKFQVSGKTGENRDQRSEPHSIGIYLASSEEVEELAKVSGFETNGWDRNEIGYRTIDVLEPDGSERLARLLRAIKEKYGFDPSETKIVPQDSRHQTFGVIKLREYEPEELDSAELLSISFVKEIIAKIAERSTEEAEKDLFVIEKGSEKKALLKV